MRLLLASLCVVLLAGCTAPGKAVPEDPLFGLCPQWDQGPGVQSSNLHMLTNESTSHVEEREVGGVEDVWANHTLDLLRVRLDSVNMTGRLELRAFSAAPEGKQLAIRDYRSANGPQMVPVVVVDAADLGQEFDVFRSPVTHDSPAAAMPIRLQWTLEGEHVEASVDYSVTFLYKVCGADP